jgi:hypothetical protein
MGRFYLVDTTTLGIIRKLLAKFQGPILIADKVMAATGSYRQTFIAQKDMPKPKFLRTKLPQVFYSDTR